MQVCPRCGDENSDRARFCQTCGEALLREPSPARESRKTVTILFMDVVGSTELGERLDPESIRRVMSRLFDVVRPALEHHGGTVEKFIGDAVMAVFGIPILHEDDALRAVRAASDIRDALDVLNQTLEAEYGVNIAVRIGVNTGEVVAGDPAGGQTLVTGDAVNVAARLEQAAAAGEILLGPKTLRLVRDAVVTEPLEPLQLKGKGEAVPACRLASVTPGAPGRMRRMASPMVGRRRELADIRQAFDRAVADRSCQLFTILAPAGIGKSRLVEEFLDRIADATILRGRCLPYGEGITYFPVLEVVKQAAGLADFDAPELVESKICALLDGEEHWEVVCKRIAQLMGVTDVAAPEETFWAIRRMLEAIAHRRALVLVFDDIHWGEATFLDLVEHVAGWSRDAPILLVCMGRPELLDLRPTWAGGKLNATTASIEPLTDDEAGQLITNLLGAADVAEELRSRIARAADGNPLFVEEMLAMLVDEGLLEQENGQIVAAADLSAIAVPPTIAALLAARLDGLPLGERAVLERASIVGGEFFRSAILELAPEDEQEATDEHLRMLVGKELVRPQRSMLSGEEAFGFRHLLIRDAAYNAMPKELRAELHERFARWLERIAGDRIPEQEEILGYHLERAWRLRGEIGLAGERGRELAVEASSRLESAARRALGRGDAPGGLNLAERAHSLVPTEYAGRSRTVRTLLRALDEAASERKLRVDDEALDVARASGDRVLEHWVRAERANDLLRSTPQDADLTEAFQTMTESARVIESQGDAEDRARVLLHLASAQWAFGDMEDMLATSERALAIALDTPGPEALDLITFVWVGMFQGSTKASVGLQRCREIEERCAAFPLRAATARLQVALTLAILGREDEARAAYEAARTIFDDAANPWVWLRSQAAEGLIEQFLAGDNEKAKALFAENARGWMDFGSPTNAALIACRWAAAVADLGRYSEAIAVADEFIALAGSWDLEPRIVLGAIRARALAGTGAVAEALDAIVEIEAMVRPTGFVFNLGEVMLAETEVFRAAGRLEDAARAGREALGIFERKEFAMHTDRARRLLAEVA